MRSKRNNERGAVAVEMALVLPILVLLVFGVIEFGRAYNAQVELRGAVREGARALALGACSTGSACSSAESAAQTSASNYTPLTFSNESVCKTGYGTLGLNGTMTVSYPLKYNIPLFGTGTWTITATGVQRCET